MFFEQGMEIHRNVDVIIFMVGAALCGRPVWVPYQRRKYKKKLKSWKKRQSLVRQG